MKTRPIIFDGESVRAILAGHKTRTRRVVKPQPEFIESSARWRWPLPARARFKGCCTEVVTASREWWEYAPKEAYPCAVGDELWVRETFQFEDCSEYGFDLADAPEGPSRTEDGITLIPRYRATAPDTVLEVVPNDTGDPDKGMRWKSPIHMPRWASRLTLRVTDVRVERVQEISELDCEAELGAPPYSLHDEAYSRFRERWDAINAKRGFSWQSNPFLWVVSFEVVDA